MSDTKHQQDAVIWWDEAGEKLEEAIMKYNRDLIKRMLEAGKPRKEIQEELGCSSSPVQVAMDELRQEENGARQSASGTAATDLMKLDGVAAVNLEEPCPGDLKRVVDQNWQLRNELAAEKQLADNYLKEAEDSFNMIMTLKKKSQALVDSLLRLSVRIVEKEYPHGSDIIASRQIIKEALAAHEATETKGE